MAQRIRSVFQCLCQFHQRHLRNRVLWLLCEFLFFFFSLDQKYSPNFFKLDRNKYVTFYDGKWQKWFYDRASKQPVLRPEINQKIDLFVTDPPFGINQGDWDFLSQVLEPFFTFFFNFLTKHFIFVVFYRRKWNKWSRLLITFSRSTAQF